MLEKRWRQSEPLRLFLCGRVTLENAARRTEQTAFAGKRGRLLFVYLALHRAHLVSKSQLLEAIWGRRRPKAADRAVDVLISKVRSVLRATGLAAEFGIVNDGGLYRLRLPSASVVDVEQARISIDRAEAEIRARAHQAAWIDAHIAWSTASQPFMPDETLPWISTEQAALRRLLNRTLLVLSEVSTHSGQFPLAVQYAADVVRSEPFDETGYQALMTAHCAAGNRAEALRVFAKCRKLFRDELGSEPSEKTAHVFLRILRDDSPRA